MNELIRECDPIEPIEDSGMLYMAKDHRPKPKQFAGWVYALALSLAIWGVVLGSLWLYFKRG